MPTESCTCRKGARCLHCIELDAEPRRLRIETTDGKAIHVTTDGETWQAARLTMRIDLPDGSAIELHDDVVANARAAREFLRRAADRLEGLMVEAGWFPGGLRQVDQPLIHDPYTMELELCGADGITNLETLNRLRRLGGHDAYYGAPFPCAGSAHLAGQHIRCTSDAHQTGFAAGIGAAIANSVSSRPA